MPDSSVLNLDALTPLTTAFTADYLENYGVLPVQLAGDCITVATWLDEVDSNALDDMALVFKATPRLIKLRESQIRAAIRRLYGSDGLSAQELITELAVSAPTDPAISYTRSATLRDAVNAFVEPLRRMIYTAAGVPWWAQ